MKKPIGSTIVYVVLMVFSIAVILYVPFLDKIKPKFMLSEFYTQEAYDVAVDILDNITTYEVDEITRHFMPNIDYLENDIIQIQELLLYNPIKEYEIIGADKLVKSTENESETTNILTFQAKNEKYYSLFTFEVVVRDDNVLIQKFRIKPAHEPLEEINKFYKDEMGFVRWLFIVVGLLFSGFTVFTVSHYYFSHKKPLIRYILLLMVSLFGVRFQWNELIPDIKIWMLSLSSLSFFRSGYAGEWIFQISIPVFTFIYWLGFRGYIIQRESGNEGLQRLN